MFDKVVISTVSGQDQRTGSVKRAEVKIMSI